MPWAIRTASRPPQTPSRPSRRGLRGPRGPRGRPSGSRPCGRRGLCRSSATASRRGGVAADEDDVSPVCGEALRRLAWAIAEVAPNTASLKPCCLSRMRSLDRQAAVTRRQKPDERRSSMYGTKSRQWGKLASKTAGDMRASFAGYTAPSWSRTMRVEVVEEVAGCSRPCEGSRARGSRRGAGTTSCPARACRRRS